MYQPTRGLPTITMVLLGFVGMSVITRFMAMGASGSQLLLIQREFSQEEANQSDLIALVAVGIDLLFQIVAGIAFLVWIYLAQVNVRQLGATGMLISPGWAVGWFLVPIANFFKPYQAFQELSKASRDPRDWGDVSNSGLITSWWVLRILLWVVSIAIMRSTFAADTIEAIRLKIVVGFAIDAAYLIVVGLAVAVIWSIHRAQIEAFDRGTHFVTGPNQGFPTSFVKSQTATVVGDSSNPYLSPRL